MKKHFWLLISSILAGTVIGLIMINIALTSVFVEQINFNKELKTELKAKNQQIDGLHKQVNRQTKRIAELTGNGG